MSKKGLSDVVTTVLIILLVLASVVIIWNVVRPFILNSSQNIRAEDFTNVLNIPQRSVHWNENEVTLVVERKQGEGIIQGLLVSFEQSDGKTNSTEISIELSAFESKVIGPFNIAEMGLERDKVSKVTVIPIFNINGEGIVSKIKYSALINGIGGDDLTYCGNGNIDAGEECDSSYLNGNDCTSFGMINGVLGCGSDCKFDKSRCLSPFDITGCGTTISSSGSYKLFNDLDGTSASADCITIAADDVVIDGEGHSIYGYGRGIVTEGTRSGAEIRNLNLNLFDNGIYLSTDTSDYVVKNVTIQDTSSYAFSSNGYAQGLNITGSEFDNCNGICMYLDNLLDSFLFEDSYSQGYHVYGYGFGSLIFRSSGYGQISFGELGDYSLEGLPHSNNLADDVYIGSNTARIVDSPTFNKRATISLYDLPTNFINPGIIKDGSVCTDCVALTDLNAGDVTFSVQGYGSYSIGEVNPSSMAGLIGRWEGENNALDSSGNGRNAVWTGTPSYSSGKIGNAFSFGGSSNLSYSTNGLISNLPSHTFSAWVYPTAFSSNPSAYSWIYDEGYGVGSGGGSIYYVGVNATGSVKFAIYTGAPWVVASSNINIPLNQWSSVICTLDSSGMKIYINGVYAGYNSNTQPTQFSPITRMQIGRNVAYAGTSFNGKIDNVNIFNRALNGAEVLSLYHSSQ